MNITSGIFPYLMENYHYSETSGSCSTVTAANFSFTLLGFFMHPGNAVGFGRLIRRTTLPFCLLISRTLIKSRPWQCLMILASDTCNHPSLEASHLLLQRSVSVQRPLERSLTARVYRDKLQPLYTLASGSAGVEVPLASGCQ